MRTVCLIATLSLVLVSTNARAAELDPKLTKDVDPALLEELKALNETLVNVEDLRGGFTQKKHTALLKQPLTSTGSVVVKGQQMRWDVVKPSPSTTLTSPGEVRIHFPRQKLIEVYRIDDRLSSVVASPLPRLDVLLKNFKIERRPLAKDEKPSDEHLAIRLTPRSEELAEHLTRVDVTIDRATALATTMEMVDADEDRVVITFSELKPNTGVKDEELELKAPQGTKIVRPLESIGR